MCNNKLLNNNNNISFVVKNYLCNSCGACYSSCNSEAIEFYETVGGYIFPKIHKGKCNNCGVCLKICPGLGFGKSLKRSLPPDPFKGNIEGCFIGKATNLEIFENSQSGGVVTSILSHLFKTQKIDIAILTVMKKQVPPRGDVLLVRSEKQLALTQKSKYTPIPILKAIRKIEKTNEKFALVGLSCHIHGLFNYFDLFKSMNNKCILKIGLVCDRVLTTSALDYLSYYYSEYDNTKSIVFRDKSKPSYPGNTVIYTNTGKETVLPPKYRMAIKEYFTPARCRVCFDKMNVFSDITVCDPHGIQDVDRIRGESAVIARTQKGREVIDYAQREGYVILRKVQAEEIFTGQKIDEKRSNWTQFISSWSRALKVTPDYGSLEISNNLNSNRKIDKDLQMSVELNEFKDRKVLLRHHRRLIMYKFISRGIKKIVRNVFRF
ncbi:Coenzyme F420 hydrogenase/dehydrogenase, beta subunit C-terminal domain [Chitinispirillales bacterium ANBcel5]|uniref:Coenzyme F420 hydrogenase/dehydrogenase, beta subunit C-terminal domain n=1 Tax=Cellulosispirillum alkaliphilum TaxID=3039283 RepID=UPI002A51EA3D|nr:Coenzyme F420 hydrogenase/dehydrogenase, beta subunit C-terminal domain [Chitinispirillales bacterium ANBcel5]